MAQSDVMCSFTRPKGTSQGEAVITNAVRITFRRGGTHRSKNEKAVRWTAFVFGCGGGYNVPTRKYSRIGRVRVARF